MALFGRKNKDSSPAIVPLMFGTNQPMTPEIIAQIGEENAPVLSHLADGLSVSYALDLPEMFDVITGRKLAELGLSHEQLHEAAINELGERMKASLAAEGGDGVWMLRIEESADLTASLILVLPVLADSLGVADLLVGVPHRVTLYLVDSSRADLVEKLREQVAADYAEPLAKPVSEKLWRLGTEGFVPA